MATQVTGAPKPGGELQPWRRGGTHPAHGPSSQLTGHGRGQRTDGRSRIKGLARCRRSRSDSDMVTPCSPGDQDSGERRGDKGGGL